MKDQNVKNNKSVSEHVRNLGITAGVALLLAQGLPSSAMATPVTYAFTTGITSYSAPSAAFTALSGLSVSGSFTYDTDGALIGSSTTGALYQGITSLSGTVGGYSFSDSSGLIAVQNDGYTPPTPTAGAPFDLLQLSADPGLGLSGSYNLQGFTVSGLTLANVRLFWIENIPGTSDFLDSNNLPPALPTYSGRLSLDFAPSPYSPVDGQPSLTGPALSIVFFDGLNVSPVTAVPLPASLPLFASGLLGVMFAKRRKLAA
jgi:hypothetical protein